MAELTQTGSSVDHAREDEAVHRKGTAIFEKVKDLQIPAERRTRRIFYGSFKDIGEENLYQEYIRNQKLNIMPTFVFTAILYLLCRMALELVGFGLTEYVLNFVANAAFVALTLLTLAVLKLGPKSQLVITLCVVFLWSLVTLSLLFSLAETGTAKQVTGAVGWIAVVIYTTFVVVPWRLRWVLSTSLLVGLSYSAVQVVLWELNKDTVQADDAWADGRTFLFQQVASPFFFSSPPPRFPLPLS